MKKLMHYELPIRPSPNLPNSRSINLYPSLCLFEGTDISIGRGTEYPFQHYGNPYIESNYSFIPIWMSRNAFEETTYTPKS